MHSHITEIKGRNIPQFVKCNKWEDLMLPRGVEIVNVWLVMTIMML